MPELPSGKPDYLSQLKKRKEPPRKEPVKEPEPEREREPVLKPVAQESKGTPTCQTVVIADPSDFKKHLKKRKEAPEIVTPLRDVHIKEGGRVVLECIVKGVPQPSVQWFMESKPIKVSELT